MPMSCTSAARRSMTTSAAGSPSVAPACDGQFGHAPGVTEAQRRLEVAEVGEGDERPVELIVGQRRAEPRVERDHLLPRRDAAEPVEDLVVPVAEAVDEVRIELRAPPLTGHAQRGLGAAGVVERLDAVGQVDQADGGSQAIGAGRPGHAPPVPPFEGLQSGSHTAGPSSSRPARSLASWQCDSMTCLHRPARGRQELADHPDPVETRLTAAEMTGDEDRHGDAGQVVVVRVRVQLGLVAEQRCHLAGVDGTAHPGQQRGVVRDGRPPDRSRPPPPAAWRSRSGAGRVPSVGPSRGPPPATASPPARQGSLAAANPKPRSHSPSQWLR